MRHHLNVIIAQNHCEKQEIVTAKRMRLPYRLIKLLFGDFCNVLVLTPGQSVSGIEITATKEGATHE